MNRTKARGKVLVCRHAESSTESKLAKSVVVKEAGGVGMILVDETDKDVAIPFVIPAAMVGKRIGNRILSYINHTRYALYYVGDESVYALYLHLNLCLYSKIIVYINSKPVSRILSSKTVLGSQPAPRIASFSSKGPNGLTPEILKVSS